MADEVTLGKSFELISREMRIAKATVEVYVIDCLAAGRPSLDHDLIASYMGITSSTFDIMKSKISSNEDNKLRSIKYDLEGIYTYNQLRFVLACMIQDLDV